MLTLYGKPASRTFRVIWRANELGLGYESLPIQSADGRMKSPEYLAINANGKIPAIKDGELRLWESITINCHLARTRGKGFDRTRRIRRTSIVLRRECEAAILGI